MAGEEKKAAKQAAADTPSGMAVEQVGKPKDSASDEELRAHAERYAAAKKQARWG
jgi:hypothetical protein